MKKTEKLTPYEKAGMRTILSEEETETHYVDTIRTYDGATVVCRIPKLAPKEAAVRDRQIVRALTKFARPDVDINKVEHMKLIL